MWPLLLQEPFLQLYNALSGRVCQPLLAVRLTLHAKMGRLGLATASHQPYLIALLRRIMPKTFLSYFMLCCGAGENGGRADVRWMSVTDKASHGLTAVADNNHMQMSITQ